VFVRDRYLNTTEMVSVGSQGEGYDASSSPSVSANGRYVAFASLADNLVPGDTNGLSDVFVRDLKLGTTEIVSPNGGGQWKQGSGGPAISADGRYVAFSDGDVFVRDRKLHKTFLVSRCSRIPHHRGGGGELPSISSGGRYVAFESRCRKLVPGDTNNAADVFVRDRVLHTTRRVSVGVHGQSDGRSLQPSISPDGRYVAFVSYADNLVPGDTNKVSDVFVRDRKLYKTIRVSVGVAGQANDRSESPTTISADGPFVAFESYATNLVAGDIIGTLNVFVRGPLH
jgi:Tol biopolymer transport system component